MKVALITVSDSCFHGTRQDTSGDSLASILKAAGFEIVSRTLLPDDQEGLAKRFEQICDQGDADLLITTGGTGLGPRDVTPEATTAIADKIVPGLAELMRSEGLKKTPRAALSRSLAAVRSHTLILNLPGSQKGAEESLNAVLPLLKHAVEIIHGAGH
ncbi:MAG TPA: MogA/MoaB family molybdenum cofactor biosynthesis protein [Acidobacteriota bacterium]|jgi:molybdenum cofactor synthesis domain-containing protein